MRSLRCRYDPFNTMYIPLSKALDFIDARDLVAVARNQSTPCAMAKETVEELMSKSEILSEKLESMLKEFARHFAYLKQLSFMACRKNDCIRNAKQPQKGQCLPERCEVDEFTRPYPLKHWKLSILFQEPRWDSRSTIAAS